MFYKSFQKKVFQTARNKIGFQSQKDCAELTLITPFGTFGSSH